MSRSRRDKNLDSEIDLVAFISLLSVCICFLLLTVVWVQVGSLQVKQAVGGQAAEDTKKEPALWTLIKPDGNLELRLENAPSKVARKFGSQVIKNQDGKPNLESLKESASLLKSELPEINMALVRPESKSAYGDVIQLMDALKGVGYNNLGVAPL
ncbi:MAG: biopolymer transporter ExbD [Bdellovibrionaceae bacterium]|nr:biopolymer transporter ExbD [Bdellovibrionales bacterium]MCB9085694.1 biopolymer transporter ExbD [Pseudobdellovibrionaceae bacterium]